MDVVLAALPFLTFLACPIMMAICVFGMRRMEGDATPSTQAAAGVQRPEDQLADIVAEAAYATRHPA